MTKKIKKKNKIKILPFCLLVLFILIAFFLVTFLLKLPIKNIYILNNKILSDEEIITLANLKKYPSFIETTCHSIEKKIKKSPYVKDVKVTKSFLAVVNIDVEEYTLLFMKASDQKIVVDIDKEIDSNNENLELPILLNYVPDTVYERFIKEMKEVNDNIRSEISEIEYAPNDYDEQRFLLYMTDGNYVYVTLTRFNLINKYNDIYPTLDNKKGILYLDSGNHFEIKSNG